MPPEAGNALTSGAAQMLQNRISRSRVECRPLLGAALWLMAVAWARAETIQEKEPDDEPEQGVAVQVPFTASGSIAGTSDTDHYCWTVPEPGMDSIAVECTPSGEADVRVALLDAQGKVLTSSNAFGSGQTEYVTSLKLAPGRYCLRVEAEGGEAGHEIPYTLTAGPVQPASMEEIRKSLGKALDYLTKKQKEDGTFDAMLGDGAAVPAFAVQAWLGAECLQRDDWTAVYRSLQHLRTRYHAPESFAEPGKERDQAAGGIFADHGMYDHGISLVALAEAYMLGVRQDYEKLLPPAVDFELRAQLTSERPATLSGPIDANSPSYGGWRYSPDSVDSDLSVTGWQVVALIAAQKAGFDVPAARLEAALRYVRSLYLPEEQAFAYSGHDATASCTAAGALSMQLLGSGSAPEVQGALRSLLTKAPSWGGGDVGYPFYYWYYGTRASVLAGGETWDLWSRATCGMLVRHQLGDGSWPPLQSEKGEAGEVYTAALGALMLEYCCGSVPPYMRIGKVQPRPPREIPNEITVAILRPGADSMVEGAFEIEGKPTVPTGLTVESVTGFLDDQELGKLTEPPWVWQADVGPGVRKHTIRLVARNSLGKEAEATVTTKEPPNDISVAILRPESSSKVEGSFEIEGKPTVPQGVLVKSVTCFLDGQELGKLTEPPWVWSADGGEGIRPHTIRVVARNHLGKEAEASVTTAKPEAWVKVHIVEPRDQAVLGTHKVVVEVEVGPDSPLESVEVTIDGQQAQSGSDAHLEFDWDFGTRGGAEIVAKARDKLGDEATDRVKLPEAPPIEVDLTATVIDAQNNYVLDLEQKDFAVSEDGVEQKIVRFSREQTAISLALVLDSSGSMKRRVQQAQDAAIRFARQIRPGDQMLVLQFSDGVQLTQPFTADVNQLVAAIHKVGAKGGTALYDALVEGCGALKEGSGRKAMLLVTDGKDENDPGTAPGSKHTYDEALEIAKESDVTIYAVGLGKEVQRDVLEGLARETGGRAYFPPAVEQLDEVYTLIGQELRSRYTIGYSSTNRVRDGAWRSVELTVPGREVQVGTKKGYYAPKE
jgi:VWFA-related protein